MPIKICILFEHKTFVPAFSSCAIAEVYGRYLGASSIEQFACYSSVPMVIYHGKQKWHKKDFTAYFSGEIDKSIFRKFTHFKR
jgi:hypothetical protein